MTSYKIAVLPGDGIGKEVVRGSLVMKTVGRKFDFKLPGKSMIGAARLITKPVG